MESWSGETNDLLDRFEYWVLQDVFPCPRKGDFFSITITDDGFVSFKVLNSGLEEKLFFCDTSQPLWIVIDMRGSLRHLVSVAATVQTRHGDSDSDSDSDINFDLHDDSDNLILSDSPIIYPNYPISLANNPIQDEEVSTNDAPSSSGAAGITPDAKNKAGKSPNPPLKDSECSLCVDAPANIAVYDCGHVCLCEACSKKLLQVERFPKCPICRKMIKDVMKIYRV
uniref:RING-type domain-containing protein n=1 Tax=Ciona savignyi TaxID=51511 RepID=H2YX87_CIOSA